MGPARAEYGFYALRATEPVRVWNTHWANAETTNQMLGALRDSFPDRRLILVWDKVLYDHAKADRSYADQLGSELVSLPPYRPRLMPVERLWQWLRRHLTALHCHRDEGELCDRICGFLAQLNDER